MSGNPVADGIVEWASLAPDRVVLEDATRSVTFGELDATSAEVAGQLLDLTGSRADGSPPWLPILVRRNVESAVAIHAAIRAGIPFAPIDATLPRSRLRHLFGRLGDPAVAIVVDAGDASALPADTRAIRLGGATGTGAVPPQVLDPERQACVVFTSGSTGIPKGVVNGWDTFEYAVARYRSKGEARHDEPPVPMLSPFSFIAALYRVAEMAVGRSYAIADPAARRPVELVDWFDRRGFVTIPLVPSLASAILAELEPGRRLDRVRRIRTFGEPLTWEHVAPLRELTDPEVVIESVYGASEAPSAPIQFDVTPETPIGTGRVPIGHPVDPDRVRIDWFDDGRDDRRGEIVVVGHVAQRYLGDAELSAARFEFDERGRRCWRSGDVVSELADGRLVHRGRLDDMTKVRGVLVEPAEAERVLRSIPGISEAAVLPHGGDHDTRLVAHLVLDRSQPASPAAVRAALGAELPRALSPSILTVHDRLPVTDRGKLDRLALQRGAVVPWRPNVVEPADRTERSIAAAFSTVLGLDVVGATDDFFDLGGDSLGAQRLCVELARQRIADVPASTVVQHPTVRALAGLVRANRSGDWSTLLPIRSTGSRPPLFCFHAASGEGILYGRLAELLGEDQPVYALQAETLTGRRATATTVEAMAAMFVEQIVQEVPEGPYLLFGQSFGGVVAFEAARLLQVGGREVAMVAMGDTGVPGRRTRSGRPAPPRNSLRFVLWGRRPASITKRLRSAAHHHRSRIRVGLRHRTGRPAPAADRRWYVGWTIQRALEAYRPTPQRGSILLFRSTRGDSDHTRGWGALVDHVAIHELAVPHDEVVTGPELPRVAAVLRAEIDAVANAGTERVGSGER